jgi:hypothetical protein
MKPAVNSARTTVAVALAALTAASVAPALAGRVASAPERSITERAIGGARLGLRSTAYVQLFGAPSRVDRLEGGLTRLSFARTAVEVYLEARVGVAVNTFGSGYRTSAGIGPCSPAGALKSAYGGRLRKLPTSGPVSLYRLGRLVFRVADGRVGAVVLGTGALARLIAGNSVDCIHR